MSLGYGIGISWKMALRRDNPKTTMHLITTFSGVHRLVFF